jgi:tetratricopeptide (TPR) repeat protein
MTLTVQRAVIVAVALVAAAWMLVSYGNSRQIRDTQIAAANPKASPAQLEAALRKLESGQSLDPSRGTESLSYEASLEIRLHRFPQALRALEQIVKREPDTAEAWFLIARLSQASDPAQAARAQAQVLRLDPRQAGAQRH